jgi:hypothetical protein
MNAKLNDFGRAHGKTSPLSRFAALPPPATSVDFHQSKSGAVAHANN